MPSGAKKRKALKKKQQEQEATESGINNKGLNGHGDISGHDEHGSQDEKESDGSVSSPGSQENEEFGIGNPSPSPPPLSGLGKVTVKEKTDTSRLQGVKGEDVFPVERATDHEVNGVDKPPNSFPEIFTHNSRKLASQEAGGPSSLEIAPAVDFVKPVGSSVSKVVMSDKNERVESLTDSDTVQQKSDKNKEKQSPGSAEEASKETKNVKESEVPECSEEKTLLPSGPPVVRTSWLSCCGLFDVMAGSER